MTEKHYLLACFRDNVGGCVAFHRKGGCGYSTDINKAELFTQEQAQEQWSGIREFELFICTDSIQGLTVDRIDHQNLHKASEPDKGP
ncbi:MAG: hypothetical protein ACN2B6_00285 [Rickettsiales bacterium]